MSRGVRALQDTGEHMGADTTAHTRVLRRGWAGALVLLLATMTFALAGAPPADAAGCCSAKRDGKNIVITGTVPFKGAKYITSGLKSSDGHVIGGQRCAAKASGRNADVKITIPIRYVPNGVYTVNSASANSDYTRFYDTDSTTFRIRNSPAVLVELKAVPKKIHRSTAATFRYATFGDVRRRKCQIDGKRWRRCSSPKTYSGLSEGGHVVKVRAFGPDGFTSTKGRRFRVDTLPPTPPKLQQEAGYYSVTVTGYGSRDAGTRVVAYEYQTSRDGESTSPIVRADSVTVHEAGTVVKFRAVDAAGRSSSWSQTDPITPTG
jgi:hypothetical protein